MKTILTLILILFCSLPVLSQNPYLSFEFLEIAADKEQLFLESYAHIEDSYSDKLIEAGIINHALIKLWYPGEIQTGYNYLAITSYPEFKQLENSLPEVIKELKTDDPKIERFLSLYALKKREITQVWRDFLEVQTKEGRHLVEHLEKNNYLMLHYFTVDPDQWDAYVDLEKKWKEVHAANAGKGRLNYWSLFGYWFEQKDIDYDLFSILVYPEFDLIDQNIWTHDTWEEVLGKENTGQFFSDMHTFRKVSRVEVWKVVSVL